jgi:hypothetical protein
MPDQQDVLDSELIRAVELLGETFANRSIRYALIGGLAATMRGQPRFTRDIDILLDVPQLVLPPLLEELARLGFVFDTGTVIREYVRESMTSFLFGLTRIDWLKPMLPLYAHALAGATLLTWTEGHRVQVVSVEGLILTKMVSFRPQDQLDIETLLVANRGEIDADLIRREWTTVAVGEENRSDWLEEALARLGPSRE